MIYIFCIFNQTSSQKINKKSDSNPRELRIKVHDTTKMPELIEFIHIILRYNCFK